MVNNGYVPQDDTFCDDNSCGDNDAQENRMGGAIDLSGTFGNINARVAFSYRVITGTTVDRNDENDQTTMNTFGRATIPVGETTTLDLGLGYTAYEEDTVTEDGRFND